MARPEYPRLYSKYLQKHSLRLGTVPELEEGPSQIGCSPQGTCMLRSEQPSLLSEQLAL